MSSPISPIQMINLPAAPQVDAAGSSAAAGGFHSMLEGMIGRVEQSQTQAQQAVDSFLNGGNEELHSVALASQRASLQFDLFLQVRNKAVSAYQEIMRMQV
jgi:flagellar hook-basal body complex protein FliE